MDKRHSMAVLRVLRIFALAAANFTVQSLQSDDVVQRRSLSVKSSSSVNDRGRDCSGTVACTQAFVEVISASQGFKGPQQKHATLYVCTPVEKRQRVRQKHHPSSSYVEKEGGK